MRALAAVVPLTLAWGCQISTTVVDERTEPRCEAADTTRSCLCDDDRFGVAECFGADDSGPCDCDGSPPGDGVEQLAMGGLHTCALLADGRVTCWGDNAQGQLGDGSLRPAAQPAASLIGEGVAALALGGDDLAGHGCALGDGGEVRCWGDNVAGQLGDGSVLRAPRPVVAMLEEATAVAAGGRHSCAIGAAGEVLCWGDNGHFQLGYETPIDPWSVTPGRVELDEVAVHLALSRHHSCAVDAAGDVWCWGAGEDGQLGDGGDVDRREPSRVEGLPRATALALGRQHTCALDVDAQVWCWGDNDRGQLGDDTVQARPAPVQVKDLPESVAIAAGWLHTCALDRRGGVRCWGDNDDGQLGDGSERGSSFAVTVDGVQGATAIAAALRSSCARLEDGGVSCWGDNRGGQLGDGTDDDRVRPVSVRWVNAPLTNGDAIGM